MSTCKLTFFYLDIDHNFAKISWIFIFSWHTYSTQDNQLIDTKNQKIIRSFPKVRVNVKVNVKFHVYQCMSKCQFSSRDKNNNFRGKKHLSHLWIFPTFNFLDSFFCPTKSPGFSSLLDVASSNLGVVDFSAILGGFRVPSLHKSV
jgi:hypothetical protein